MGLQTDGDLWEIAWAAIIKRGVRNQDLRKVKGHATAEDIEAGRSNNEDRKGNGRSDTNADLGVDMLAGEGLATLGKWVASRHDDYKKLLKRIHRMIAVVTIAEKSERGKAKAAKKTILGLGYDPEKWMDTCMKIRSGNQDNRTHLSLDLPPPIQGKHKHSSCQQMYLDVHAFLRKRKWAPTEAEEDGAGVTWAELFIMFDISGERSHLGEHVVDPKAKERAEARKANSSRAKQCNRSNKKKQDQDAVVKPVFEAELKRFKAIVRQIAKHELEPCQSKLFHMESRGRLRRLADLGIYGHQPGIAAHVHVKPEEEEKIVEAILKQKVGSNHRTIKQYREFTAYRKEDVNSRIRIRIARIATRTVVKWDRSRKVQGKEDKQEDRRCSEEKPTYANRILACSRCGTTQETKWMQLRTTNGYRAIHCRGCKKQETVAKTRCQCGVIWHRCESHRVDPATHSSRKGRKGLTKKLKTGSSSRPEIIQSSKRKAPVIEKSGPPAARIKRRKRGNGQAPDLTSHARRVMHLYPPGKIAVERLKRKMEGRKDVEDVVATPRAVQRRLRGKQKEPKQDITGGPGSHTSQGASHDDRMALNGTERVERRRKEPPMLESPGNRKKKVREDQAAESETEQKRTKSRDKVKDGATSSRTRSCNNTATVIKRKAGDIEGGRSKAEEEEAIRRIIDKREAKDSEAQDGETDEELIELCWLDLLTDGAAQDERAAKEDKFDEANSKRPRRSEPVYDHDPKLPGDGGTTRAISARLWSESRGLKRITIEEHTRIQEGKQPINFAKQTRGTSSERASKVHKGVASRIHQGDMHAINRLIKRDAATSSSDPPRSSGAGSCSSNVRPGSFLKKPP